MSKKLVSLLVAISFLLIATIALAGPPTPATQKEAPKQLQQQPMPVVSCPAGWHKKPGTTFLVCVPNKPAPISCPKGYQYYEKLTCSAGTVGELGQLEPCDGCKV